VHRAGRLVEQARLFRPWRPRGDRRELKQPQQASVLRPQSDDFSAEIEKISRDSRPARVARRLLIAVHGFTLRLG